MKKIDYWVSEKDNGIYDAFNKGMIVSKGEFIGFINSDDIYKKDALSIISNYIRKNKAADFIFGSVKNIGVFYMVTNLIKSNTAGVFIVVIPQDFLLKGKLQKR